MVHAKFVDHTQLLQMMAEAARCLTVLNMEMIQLTAGIM
jgi:hypothetical protein